MRYLKLYWEMVKYNLNRELQFRADFWLSFLSRFTWFLMLVFFFDTLYRNTATINGWSFYQSLLLVSVFQFLELMLFVFFVRNLARMNDYISEGELDFLLLKPVDTQFFASLRYFSLTSLLNVVGPLVLFIFAARHLHLGFTLSSALLFIFAFLASFVILYSLWFLTVITLFWFTKIFEIQDLFLGVFRYMQYPSSIYRGATGYFLSFVFPIILTVTLPAQILLHTLERPSRLLALPLLAIITLAVSRLVWLAGLRRYSSASS